MNIWILNHYAITAAYPGITRHFDFAQEFTKLGHNVTIYASSFSHSARKQISSKKNKNSDGEDIDGVTFVWIKTNEYKRNNWRRVLNMIEYFIKVIFKGLMTENTPDIILASSPHLLNGLAGYIIAKIRNCPFIFEIRDLWPQVFVDVGQYRNNSLIVWILRLLEKFLYTQADRIIVLLPKAADYITGLGISAKKIFYIPNGIRLESYIGQPTDLPSDLKSQLMNWKIDHKFIIGYTGAHGIADGLDVIIGTAKIINDMELNNIRFLLIGEGPEKESLIKKACANGLSNIFFFKPIAKSMMPSLISYIDIAIVPLRKSPLWKYGVSKNKLFEYMACCKPIIWSINSINNPVEEAQCGITVPPSDAEALSQAVLKMSKLGRTTLDEMGNKGRDYVIKHHSIPILAEKLLKVIIDARTSHKNTCYKMG